MFVYLIMLCGIALIYYFCDQTTGDQKSKNRSFLIFSGLFIVLILGSRWEGYGFADTWMYIQNFEQSKLYSFEKFLNKVCKGRDPGYYSMVWVLARIFPNKQWFIYFECAFLVFSVFVFIYYTTDKPLFAVFIFLGAGIFSFYMSAFRQAFAFAFCLLSYLLLQNYIKEKEKEKEKEKGNLFSLLFGLIFFYIATTMHKSAIVFAIALLICLIKNHKFKMFAVFISSILIIWFREALLSSGNGILDKEYEVEANFSMFGFIIQIIIFAFPLVLLAFTPPKATLIGTKEQEIQYNNLLAIAIVGIVFYLLRLYALTFERIAIYFTIAVCSLYPTTFEKTLAKKNQSELTWIICIICSALLLWRVMGDGAFVFFWQK